MTAAQTPPQPTTTNAPAPDLARALLERQLWVLGQLAEGGLEIARAIERRATSDESPDAVLDAAPMAYARVSRAVRMTILLQSKLIADLQTLEAKAAHEAAHANSLNGTQRVCREHDQKRRIGRTVARIAWADDQDLNRAQRLGREAVERLEEDELYGDILNRPFSEIVAQICDDMGLQPDWPQLADEAWAKADLNTGVAAAPLAAVMAEVLRPLPLAGEGDREAVERAYAWQTASAEPLVPPHAPSVPPGQLPRQRGSSRSPQGFTPHAASP